MYYIVFNHRYVGIPEELSICSSKKVTLPGVGRWRAQKLVLKVPTKAVRGAMRSVRRLAKVLPGSVTVELKVKGPYWLRFIKFRGKKTTVVLRRGPKGGSKNAWNITKQVKRALVDA